MTHIDSLEVLIFCFACINQTREVAPYASPPTCTCTLKNQRSLNQLTNSSALFVFSVPKNFIAVIHYGTTSQPLGLQEIFWIFTIFVSDFYNKKIHIDFYILEKVKMLISNLFFLINDYVNL